MPLQRVKGMPLQPNCCTICGSNPSNDDGTFKEAIFAEGVDIDWGNSLYICWDCGELIADLMGRATREGFDHLTDSLEELTAAHGELQEKYDEQEEELDKIREGVAASRRLREKAGTR